MTRTDLAQRYGAPSPARRRLLVAASVALAVAFLAWLSWTAFFHSTPEARSSLVTYAVVDEHTATAKVDVDLADADVVATCLLRAYAEDHSVVGEKSFEATGEVAAGGATYEQEIRTERLATSVQLIGCTTANQSRPR